MKTGKAVVAGVGALVTVLTAAFADDIVNANEAGTIAACAVEQAITVFTVYKMRNFGYVYDPIKYQSQAR